MFDEKIGIPEKSIYNNTFRRITPGGIKAKSKERMGSCILILGVNNLK